MNEEEIKKVVKKRYSQIAEKSNSCCAPVNACCGPTISTENMSKVIGYSDEELKSIPKGANLGLGCGNPTAIASLKEGETVLDLGSGAGFDCFLAANKVGKKGKIIGVDMTPEMIDKARENAKKGNYKNVVFEIGEIENLPVADNSVDVVISNCVINLSPNKNKVFEEIFRVLKPSGRFAISDIVLLKELPDFIKNSINAYVGCVAGAIIKEEYLNIIKDMGFSDVEVVNETVFPSEIMMNDPMVNAFLKHTDMSAESIEEIINSIISIKVMGRK